MPVFSFEDKPSSVKEEVFDFDNPTPVFSPIPELHADSGPFIPENSQRISTITGKPVPTTEEKFGQAGALPYFGASIVRGVVPKFIEDMVGENVIEPITGMPYRSPIEDTLKYFGEGLPNKKGKSIIGTVGETVGAALPVSEAFNFANWGMTKLGLPVDLVLKNGSVLEQIAGHILRGGIAGATYGVSEHGPSKEAEDTAFAFSLAEGALGATGAAMNKLGDWFRRIEIKDRGRVVQSLDDMLSKGYTEPEVLNRWNNPTWRIETLGKRINTEAPLESTTGIQKNITRADIADPTVINDISYGILKNDISLSGDVRTITKELEGIAKVNTLENFQEIANPATIKSRILQEIKTSGISPEEYKIRKSEISKKLDIYQKTYDEVTKQITVPNQLNETFTFDEENNRLKNSGLESLAKEQNIQSQRGEVNINNPNPNPSYSFESPETERLFQSAKGIKPEGIISRIETASTEIGHKITRDFEHLENIGKNAQLIFDLKRLEKQKDVVADKTARSIGETTSGLNPDDYDLFSRKVILDDLLSDYNRGLYANNKELPFKFTPESLINEKNKIDVMVSAKPKIEEAITKHQSMWEQVQDEYIEALSPYKPGVEDMFKENYYRHQVLDYVENNGLFGTGKRLRSPINKGYTKGRTGYSGLYNTDYLEAEHNIMAQMLHDIETARTLTKIKSREDISKQVRKNAKDSGLDDWHKAIPDGYTIWQPKEGNIFYPVLTVSEKTAESIMAGEIKDIVGKEIGDIFKQVLAVGGKRKEWVVREEVADTLNNLVREYGKGIISSIDLKIMANWKRWQLLSPRRYFKYQSRNATGDAEAGFIGNPRAFKSVPQATKELYDMFFRKKPMSPNMTAWFERGGVGSTLQAQEMDNLKQTWMFSRLHKEGTSNLNIWKKYWNTVRLTSDFRESILRYANFLEYKEQIISGKGKPLNYGASKPGMIDALQDYDDKAFWLSNDLCGPYDRVSVAGQVIRERAIPFWSWQEVNFKRYIQLFKNAANNETLTSAIGKKLGATTARTALKIGSLAIKMTAFTSMLAVYNNTFFPEEEKKLSPDLKTTSHIILGTDDKGNIEYFNRMGTLDDFISWFGLDYAPKFINEYLSGKKTLKEFLQDQAKKTYEAPVNKVVQGAAPFTKLLGELFIRRSTFPDIFKPGTIRDRWLHVARSFGLENEYIAMAGLPSKGYGESLKGLFLYKVAPGEMAFRTIYDLKSDFMKKIGRTSEGFWLTPTGDALYNMKLAIKYDDKKAFSKYFTEYISLAGEQGRTKKQIVQGLKTSIRTMHPLYGMNNQIKTAFINSLNSDDKKTLVQAIDFFNETLQGYKQEKK